jgi:hypothetical protein
MAGEDNPMQRSHRMAAGIQLDRRYDRPGREAVGDVPERRRIPVRSPFPPVPLKPLLQLLIGLCFVSPFAAETLLAHNGEPRAAIVVAESLPRTVRLAAQGLQDYFEKITGAHLPIVTQPGRAGTVPIYVGCSEHTDRLRITAEGLQDGAYRIVSGDGWLVLIGQDAEFTPIEPWARNNATIARIQAKRGQFDEALATLGRVEMDKLRGFWHDSMLLARGDTLRAADRKAEALAAYKSILAEDSGDPRLRKVAEEKIKALEGRQP